METCDFVVNQFVLEYVDEYGREREMFFPRLPDNAKGVVSYPWPGERRITYKHEGEPLTTAQAVRLMREMLGY